MSTKKLLNKRDIPILHVNRAKLVMGTVWGGSNRRGIGPTHKFVNGHGFYTLIGLELMRLMNKSKLMPLKHRDWDTLPVLVNKRDNMYKKLLVDEGLAVLAPDGVFDPSAWTIKVNHICFTVGTLPAKERELVAMFAERGVTLLFYGEYVRP